MSSNICCLIPPSFHWDLIIVFILTIVKGNYNLVDYEIEMKSSQYSLLKCIENLLKKVCLCGYFRKASHYYTGCGYKGVD